MKKILFTFISIIPIYVYAQLDTLGYIHYKNDSAMVVRIPRDDTLFSKEKAIIASIGRVERLLNMNKSRVVNNSVSLRSDIRVNLGQIAIEFEKITPEITAVYLPEIAFYKRIIGDTINPSKAKVEFTEKNPYRNFEINLDIMSKNLQSGYFTIFRGVDVNFTDARFSRYLQEIGLTIDDKSVVFRPTKISVKYRPKVSSTGNEYVIVNYTIKKDTEKVPYITGAPCNIIQKVEITGTADIIIRIFIHYWDFKMTIGGYKRGEIASYQTLGDYVVLSGTDKPGICKITISKGSIDADYYTTFNIK